MVKAKKEIEDNLKLIDVVLVLLDARIPIASQNPDLADMIKNKKQIFVLNKSDLSDEKENQKWIKYFGNAVCTDLTSGKGIKEVIKKIEENKKEFNGRVRPVRALVLGIPNVGKSSFINRITKSSKTKVGNKPGVTKQKQWVRLNENIELLDTPGVLWPKLGNEEIALNLAFTGTIKDDILDKEEIAYRLLEYLKNNYIENLKERYKVEEISLDEIARKRGALQSGGVVDYTKVSNIILDDFRTGKLGKITLEKVK